MNIGLVVNAKGKMCMVYDEPFAANPLWVGYHVLERRLEIVFDTGELYPIQWESTDEMDLYLTSIKRILLIRMENKVPVEGWDTSLVMLRGGRVVPGVQVKLEGPLSGSDKDGSVLLKLDYDFHTEPPSLAILNGLSYTLCFRWPDGTEHFARLRSAKEARALLRHTHVHVLRTDPSSTSLGGTWIPLQLSMKDNARTRPEYVANAPAPILGGGHNRDDNAVLRLDTSGKTTDGRPVRASFRWFNEGRGYGLAFSDELGRHVLLQPSDLSVSEAASLIAGDPLDLHIAGERAGVHVAMHMSQTSHETAADVPDGAATAAPAFSRFLPDLPWTDLSRAEADSFLDCLDTPEANLKTPGALEALQRAVLPCYPRAYLIRARNSQRSPPNLLYALWNPAARVGRLLDGGARTVFAFNSESGIHLTAATARSYLRFFFSAVRDRPAPMRLLLSPADIPWSAAATPDYRRRAAAHIQQPRLAGEDASGRYFEYSVTLLSRDALIGCAARVYRRQCQDCEEARADESTHAEGELRVLKEKLLLEHLPVITDLSVDPLYH